MSLVLEDFLFAVESFFNVPVQSDSVYVLNELHLLPVFDTMFKLIKF